MSTLGSRQLEGRTLGIVGLGLIGASLAAALRARHVSVTICGYDQSRESSARALELGYVDQVADSPQTLCKTCDLVVLAVPVLSTESVLRALAPALSDGGTVVTDVGSVKCVVDKAAHAVFGELPSWLVPGHPIAGSEFSGVNAANPALYENHQVILTPAEDTEPGALDLVTSLWQAVGASVEVMSVSRHDEVLAATSHLPHLLAFSLVDSLAQESEKYEIFHYAAGGFRDFTRIAASDPTMWHDIFLSNDQATLDVLDRYMTHLQTVRDALATGDGDTLFDVFTRAKKARDHFSRVLDERQSSTT